MCDADGSGGVSATDALAALRLAVGQPMVLGCEQCPGTGVRREDVRSVAAAIYDRVAAGQPLSAAEVAQIFESFSIPAVASSDGATFEGQLTAGKPPLLDFQAAAIGRAMAMQTLMPVDSFLAGVSAAGAAHASNGAPLTAASLGAALLPIALAQSYSADQVLPALVIALGRERAARAGGSDPVWGDGMLDPLQVALLLYEIEYSAFSPAAGLQGTQHASAAPGGLATGVPARTRGALPGPEKPEAAPAAGKRARATAEPNAQLAAGAGTTSRSSRPKSAVRWVEAAHWASTAEGPERRFGSALPTLSPLIPKIVRGQIGAKIGKLIDFPIGWTSSIGASICASIVLYSYQMTLDVTPDLITHRRPGENSPYRSTATAHLEFDFQQDLNSLPKQIALFIGNCNLPPKGPARKPVEWRIDGKLPEHGSLVQKDTSTNALGDATATYEAVDELLPKELRAYFLLDSVTGNVWVKATDLMPAWQTFELVVRPLVRGNGGEAVHILQVQFYRAPRLTFVMRSDMHTHFDTGQDYYSTVSTNVHLKPPPESSGILKYEAKGRSAYDSFRLTDSLRCSHALGYWGSNNHVTIPLDPGAGPLGVYFFPGNPGERILHKCPGDKKSVTTDTLFWFTAWMTGHGTPGPNGFLLDGWQGDPNQGVLTRDYSQTRSAGAGISVTEKTHLELRLQGPP
ncbi:MAG: hypothetical protein D6815_08205 [Candidatus Dadabacteria bacterium]|nr:MAG: hypothetical protein D6815_08205 [Candidatus Dadabacteria bacterium]